MPGQPLGMPSPASSNEVEEGRPWWKVCCVGCCLGLIILIVLFFISIRMFWGPGPKTLDRLPETFPSQLVLYRPEEAREILYYSGSSKSVATKIITGPLDWIQKTVGSGSATGTRAVGAIGAQLKQIEGRDTVSIRWENLSVSRDDLIRFYTGALRQAGIYNPQTTNPQGTWDVTMGGTNGVLSFSLIMSDDPDKPGIDTLTVVTDYPVTSATSR